MPLVQASERIGTRIAGKYQIVRLIGEGGMGAVFEARHVQLGRRMAVKLLRAEHVGDRASVERFLREARVAASIGHPSIVEIFDYGEAEDGAPYIVMSYLEGETLADRLYRKGRLDEETAALALLPVMGALERAHQRGIVHRDLKPENIVLARNSEGVERPTLVDFGVSKFLSEADHKTKVTRSGTVLGTPAYMPPEQARGQADVDGRADVYSVGAVLYELLTGVCPFQRENYHATLAAILTEPLRPPSDIVETISQPMESVVLTAMAKDPAKRFQTIGEMRRMLADAIDAPITQAPSAQAPAPAAIRPRAPRRHGAEFADDRFKTVMISTTDGKVLLPGAPSNRKRLKLVLGVGGAALLCLAGVGLLAYAIVTATPREAPQPAPQLLASPSPATLQPPAPGQVPTPAPSTATVQRLVPAQPSVPSALRVVPPQTQPLVTAPQSASADRRRRRPRRSAGEDLPLGSGRSLQPLPSELR